MKLAAGQRLEVPQDSLLLVETGLVELYASAKKGESYRQVFLLEKKPGDAVFPALDEFGVTKLYVYAVEDSELAEKPWAAGGEDLRVLMRGWLTSLVRIDWVRRLANLGDDMLLPWLRGTVLAETPLEKLAAEFRENQEIFCMLIGVRLRAEEKTWQERAALREKQKERLIDEGIDFLLEKESVRYEEGASEDTLNEATFIVQRCARAFGMPTEAIRLSPELVRRMEPDKLLRRLIQKGNMQLRRVRLEDGWHKMDSGVLISFLEEGEGNKKETRLAALVQDRPGRYKIYTAEHPEGKTLTDEMEAKLARGAYTLYAGLPRRVLKVKDLLLFMFRQCWQKDYLTILFASLVGSIVPLLTPVITETIFQDVIPIQDRLGLATITQVMMVASFTLAAISIVRSVAVLRITTHLNIATEAALWNRLLALPTKFFRRYSTGELASRMDGISAVKSVVSGDFATTVCNTVFSIWSLFLMCWYSMKLTAAALAVWAVYCLVIAFIYRRVLRFQREAIRASNEYSGLVQQIFTGLSKFRVQGAEAQAYHLWSKSFGKTWHWNLKLRWQNNYNAQISAMEPFLLSMMLYYVALYGMTSVDPVTGREISGISYPEFLAFSAAYSTLNGSLHSVIPLVGTFFTIQPHIENLRPILEELPESDDDKMDADLLTGEVSVSHLSFAYTADGPDILKDLNFTIKPGTTVAIVGRSGCGKSTLVRLLLGFEQPKTGSVTYDGQNLVALSLPSVRSQMGIVLQNGQLMTGDIYTNIIGTSNLTQREAWQAAEAAGVAEDIRRMPMGMQTIISEGSSNISGGQKQRILIARALAGNPRFIIFDEATSALDNRTQAIVTRSLEALHATRIVVAHRLSTIRGADRILVMDAGKIVEDGSFDELVAQNGLFAALVRRQVA